MYFPSHDVRARFRHMVGAAIVALGLASPFDAVASPREGAPLVVASAAKKKKKRKKKHSVAPKRKKGGKKATKRKGHAEAASAPAKSTRIPFDLPVERLSLDNGLRVVLSVDHGSPTIAVAVTYDVGARQEPPQQRGVSLLLGELLFQGSKNLDKGEHARLVGERGGRIFSEVGVDRCDVGEALPSSELALALFLEADRMKSLALDEAGFASMRARIKDGLARESAVIFSASRGRLRELVYQGFAPYEHDIARHEGALASIRLEDLRAFHARTIGPNNAVLSITGDFEPEEAKRLVHRFFDEVPRIEVVPPPEALFPEQTSQRTAVVRDDVARAPQVLYGWAIPPSRGEDHEALELAAHILGEGRSSRLYHLLMREKSMARAVSAKTGARRGSDIFALEIELFEGVKVGNVEKIVEGELKSLMRAGPSDAELERAKMQLQAMALAEMQSNLSRARRLGEYELFYGDAGLLEGRMKRYFELTRNDIKRAVAKHLGPTRRTIVETYPTAALAKAKK